MSYVKQTWATGDVITADKLNHMEGGIEGAEPFRIDYTPTGDSNGYTCNKTLTQIFDAWNNGKFIYAVVANFNILMPVTVSVEDSEINFSSVQYNGIATESFISVQFVELTHLLDDNSEVINVTFAYGKVSVANWTEA